MVRASFEVFARNVYEIGKPVFDTLRGWWEDAVAWADWAWTQIVDGTIWMGDLVINAFKVAAAGATYAFQGLPDAVGALAVGAANAVIDAVNWMIDKALTGINALTDAANAALGAVGLDPVLTTIDPAAFRIDAVDNPYVARDGARRAALTAQIRGIVGGSPLSEFFDDVRTGRSNSPSRPTSGGRGGNRHGRRRAAQHGRRGGRGSGCRGQRMGSGERGAGNLRDRGHELGRQHWHGDHLGLPGRGRGRRHLCPDGKVDVRELVTSIIADMAKIGAQRFVFGPLASALGGIFAGFATVLSASVAGTLPPGRLQLGSIILAAGCRGLRVS